MGEERDGEVKRGGRGSPGPRQRAMATLAPSKDNLWHVRDSCPLGTQREHFSGNHLFPLAKCMVLGSHRMVGGVTEWWVESMSGGRGRHSVSSELWAVHRAAVGP